MADAREGKTLQGRNRTQSLLAEGGMGVVYKGERVGIGRPVVVKFLHAVLSDKPGIVDRFEREARATARLNHPNCVALVDFGIDEGAPYLVMEYVEGKTLADLLDHGPLPAARACHIAHQILAGLEHAHERGILHRDLKPANVMIVDVEGYPGDFVKILDFGLAKLAWPGEDKRDVTVEGIAIGTPGYMSPEQAAGVPSDRRSDIYCAGALLYHLVTGNKIFEGDDVRDVLRRHREETPALAREIKPGTAISDRLEEVLAKALQRDPHKRWQHAREMAAALVQTPEMQTRARDDKPPPLPGVKPPPTPSPSDDQTRAEMPASKRKKRGGATATWTLAGIVAGAVGALAAFAYSPLGQYVRPAPKPTPSTSVAVAPVPTTPIEPAHETAKAAVDMAHAIAVAPADLATTPVAVAAANKPDAASEEDEEASDDGSNENDRTPPPEPPAVAARPAPSVRSVADVKALIKKGDTDGAIAGLQKLRKGKLAPAKASEVATLLGGLYFEKKWWTDALREYRFAITLDAHAKKNRILVDNSVHALADRATVARAHRLIVDYIGKEAVVPLKRAAKSGGSPQLRKNAQKVLATLESKSYRSRR